MASIIATSRLALRASSLPHRAIQRSPSRRTRSSRPSGVYVCHASLVAGALSARRLLLIDHSVDCQTEANALLSCGCGALSAFHGLSRADRSDMLCLPTVGSPVLADA